MASIRETAVELVLRARNLLSGETEKAADSVEELSKRAKDLQDDLRAVEDQQSLVKNLSAVEKEVARNAKAFERASKKAEDFGADLAKQGSVTEEQAREFKRLKDAAGELGEALGRSEKELKELQETASESGIDVQQLGREQRRLKGELIEGRRAIRDNNNALRDSRDSARGAGDAAEEYGSKVEAARGRLKRFGASLASTAASFAKWGAAAVAAVGALSATAITRFTKAQSELARQTLVQADAFGLSTDELQKFQAAAKSVGIEGDKVADILKDVSDKIGDAFINGGGAALEVIERLNLDLDKLVKLRPDEQIRLIGSSLGDLPRAGQVQVMEALASDASLLLPLLENNNAELNRLGNLAQQRGAIFTQAELKTLAAVDTAFRGLGTSVEGVIKRITVSLAPAFTNLAQVVEEKIATTPELFTAIAEEIGKVIDKTAEWAKQLDTNTLTDILSDITSKIRGVSDTISLVTNGLLTFSSRIAQVLLSVAASAQSAVVNVKELGNALNLVSDESVKNSAIAFEGLVASIDATKKRGDEFQQKFSDALEKLAGTSKKTAGEVADSTRQMSEGFTSLEDSAQVLEQTDESISSVSASLKTLKDLSPEVRSNIEQLGAAVREANAAWQEEGTAEAASNLKELKAAYQEARIEAGLTTQAIEDQVNVLDWNNTEVERQAVLTAKAAAEIDRSGQAVERQQKAMREARKETEQATEALDEMGRSGTASAGSVGAAFAAVFSGFGARLSSLSQAAGSAFSGLNVDPLVAGLQNATALLRQTQQTVSGNGIGRALNDIAERAFKLEQAFFAQAIAARNLSFEFENNSEAALRFVGQVDRVRNSFGLLDRQQLSGLIGQIRAAERQVDSLKDSLENTIVASQIELATLSGDLAEVDRLQAERRREELEEQLRIARVSGDREAIELAQEAIRLQEQITQEKREQAKEAERQQKLLEDAEREARERLERERERREDAQQTRDRDSDLFQPSTSRQIEQLGANVTQVRTVRLDLGASGNSFGQLNVIDDGAIEQLILALERAGYVIGG